MKDSDRAFPMQIANFFEIDFWYVAFETLCTICYANLRFFFLDQSHDIQRSDLELM